MAKANVYIDGFNLCDGAVKGSPHKWLDLGALCHRMLPNDTVQSIRYFTAIVSARPSDLNLPIRQQMYLRALRMVGNLKISYGHFLTHSCHRVLTGSNPPKKVWVDKTEEKGSDANLASHLLRDGDNRAFEVAVLATNDSDLVEPVRIVRHELKLPVGILNAHQHHSVVLKNEASFMKRIRQADVAACQFPNVMADSRANFISLPLGDSNCTPTVRCFDLSKMPSVTDNARARLFSV